jgi:MarR family transcriptional regulator, transcriptional regulator for hemolysin
MPGEAAFLRLRGAALAFDQRLRQGITSAEFASLECLLRRLTANVETNTDAAAPWAGLIDSPGDPAGP